MPAAKIPESSTQQTRHSPAGYLQGFVNRHRWAVYVLPLLTFMLLGTLEPTTKTTQVNSPNNSADSPETETSETTSQGWLPWQNNPDAYPIVYTIRIAVTAALMLLLLPGYKQHPFRVSLLGVGIGVIGAVLWIGLCQLQLEARLLGPLGLKFFADLGQRVAYNPIAELGDRQAMMIAFLVVRFLGLALIVPIIEEFFLRGFFMRFFIDNDWWAVPFGRLTQASLVACIMYAVLSHPAELLAAALWFSLVTWLMVRTRSLWDCVAAHAVTNLLLGIWVLTTGQWWLW